MCRHFSDADADFRRRRFFDAADFAASLICRRFFIFAFIRHCCFTVIALFRCRPPCLILSLRLRLSLMPPSMFSTLFRRRLPCRFAAFADIFRRLMPYFASPCYFACRAATPFADAFAFFDYFAAAPSFADMLDYAFAAVAAAPCRC